MKKLLALLILTSSLTVLAQTPTNTPPSFLTNETATALQTILAQGSNFFGVVAGMVTTDGSDWGGSVALGYQATPILAPIVRLDYFGKERELWSASVGVELQVPIKISSVTVHPFAFSSLAMDIAGSRQGQANAIMGAGAAVDLSSTWFLVADYERWTGIVGDQIRFGVGFHF